MGRRCRDNGSPDTSIRFSVEGKSGAESLVGVLGEFTPMVASSDSMPKAPRSVPSSSGGHPVILRRERAGWALAVPESP
jgi:hypothetical protein